MFKDLPYKGKASNSYDQGQRRESRTETIWISSVI